MQKLDFVYNLKTVVEKLQSEEIVKKFEAGFSQPNQNYQYNLIVPLLFLSKSNYDQIKSDESYSKILESLNSDSIYNEVNLSHLTTLLKNAQASSVLLNSKSISLYNFHNSLVSTLKLSNDILQNNNIQDKFEESIQDGINIFQISIETEGLETEKYIKIFIAFQELIETLSKVLNETVQKSEIILLDSGSDTNIGIRTGIETAKSLFLIFKEIWEYITNHKFYKQNQKNKALIDSLTIRAEIQSKVESGVITAEEGQQYTHMIKTRTDDLIGMKVLPKQILIETNQIENKKLLNDFEGFKMLSSGE